MYIAVCNTYNTGQSLLLLSKGNKEEEAWHHSRAPRIPLPFPATPTADRHPGSQRQQTPTGSTVTNPRAFQSRGRTERGKRTKDHELLEGFPRPLCQHASLGSASSCSRQLTPGIPPAFRGKPSHERGLWKQSLNLNAPLHALYL